MVIPIVGSGTRVVSCPDGKIGGENRLGTIAQPVEFANCVIALSMIALGKDAFSLVQINALHY